MSRAKKIEALVKLGVTPIEARRLYNMWSVTTTEGTFSTTFGVEIETTNCNPMAFCTAASQNGLEVANQMHHYNHTDIQQFKLVPDSSLRGSECAECVSPALKSDRNGFKSLEACCKALGQVGARVNSSCGLHVHIGAAGLTQQEYCNVFLNYQKLEVAIDSFMARSRRDDASRWCHTLRGKRLAECTSINDVQGTMHYDRYFKVNAMAWDRHQTIEFRQHQGTTNFLKIKNWVNFLVKLVGWSRTNRLDHQVNYIEDIPFLTQSEKSYFISRRDELNRAA